MALVTTEKYASFSNSKNPTALVNLAGVCDAGTLDIPALPNQPASTAEYQIVFTLKDADSNEKTQVIKYETAAQRDADLASFIAATTVVI